MKAIFFGAMLVISALPSNALAMFSCEGSLTQNNFVDERKKAQAELQKSILEYRKAETNAAAGEPADAQLAAIKEKIEKQKKTFQDLDSKYFPSTPVTAFGAACNDMRWLEIAKAKLVENPEHLGKHWYVWLDKSTRKPMAALKRVAFEAMAEDK